jgi:4,5-DOPA dioxygenase extradiol
MTTSQRMPAIFIGHGSPLLAFEDNAYTRNMARMGRELPRPRAILCISAHWYTRGTGVTAMDAPRTIHDFSGFPDELYRFHYRCKGDPALAQQVAALLKPLEVTQDLQWGLDHGCWTVLKHMYPQADIPVVQLSIDGERDAEWHYNLGRQLAPLRDDNVLLLGTGNIVHNLRYLVRDPNATALPWASEFQQHIRDAVEQRDHQALIHYERFGDSARLSVPTTDHYLPLLYIAGASNEHDAVTVSAADISIAAVSMMSVQYG